MYRLIAAVYKERSITLQPIWLAISKQSHIHPRFNKLIHQTNVLLSAILTAQPLLCGAGHSRSSMAASRKCPLQLTDVTNLRQFCTAAACTVTYLRTWTAWLRHNPAWRSCRPCWRPAIGQSCWAPGGPQSASDVRYQSTAETRTCILKRSLLAQCTALQSRTSSHAACSSVKTLLQKRIWPANIPECCWRCSEHLSTPPPPACTAGAPPLRVFSSDLAALSRHSERNATAGSQTGGEDTQPRAGL